MMDRRRRVLVAIVLAALLFCHGWLWGALTFIPDDPEVDHGG
jgi:hypothetical protein